MTDQISAIFPAPYVANPTMPRPQWLMYSGLLTSEQCQALADHARTQPEKDATIFRNANLKTDSSVRKTRIRWLNRDDVSSPLFVLLDRLRIETNKGFRVDVDYLPPLQFAEYEVGDHYGWHHDVNLNDQSNRSRKISVVIQLSDPEDYEGGEFEFHHTEMPNREELKKRGTIIFLNPLQ